ncbi:MAG: hypothetical protein AB7P76_02845 [Candidatus Melainabacteria bacterium]
MSDSDFMPPAWGNRWYDRDPALSRAMDQLQLAEDKYQAQIALNIIKIIVEHQIEEGTAEPVEDISTLINQTPSMNGTAKHRRWYDLNATLHSAIVMLNDTPEDLQSRIIPAIASMIEDTLKNSDI